VLTADQIDVRRRGDELHLVAFDGERRQLATALAAELYAALRGAIGASREEVETRLAAVDAPARARRLVLGMKKILDDRADWEGAVGVDPIELRREVFQRAAAARATMADDERFDAQAVLVAAAASLGLDVAAVERGLFADLRAAEILRGLALPSAAMLVEEYASQQVQAMLLRAARLSVRVRCDSPGAYRALFRRIKFLRLLHSIHPLDDGRYALDIDGPYSLFESVTKYGLQLALLVPVLAGASEYELDAEIRWTRGGDVRTLRFRHRGGGGPSGAQPVSDDALQLLEAITEAGTPWRPSVADTILSMPGLGVCVPDLALTNHETGEVVYVELLGWFSRDAVWKRKALVEGGLCERIVFVGSQKLRVREALLPDDSSGALYLYKTSPSAKVLLERVEALAKRAVR
jgi:predicted nuclease of restriction endonuclease-like RecB superfamily